MPTKTISWTVLIVILFNIFYCNGDVCSCKCCTDKFCKAEFQGSVVVPKCTSESCRSICQSRYPKICVDNSNSTFHQCLIGHDPIPDWPGIFDVEGLCDSTACCCPVRQTVLWGISETILRVQMIVVGSACNGSTYLDQTMILPISFSLQVPFFGQLVEIQLSQDSRTIQLVNPTTPSCSENGRRHGSPPISLGTTIQSASMFLLIFLTSLTTFILE